MRKIIVLPCNNSLNFLDDVKDRKNIIYYSKVVEKINNNDILKYPANKDVINFYIILDLLIKLVDHDVIYIVPNTENYQIVYNGLINILKTQRNINRFELFCIEDANANSDYFIYNTNILNETKWVLEYSGKIVHSENNLESIQNHISNSKFTCIGMYFQYENKKTIESKLYSI